MGNEVFKEVALAAKDEYLARLYSTMGRAVDSLPYTPVFDALLAKFASKYPNASPDEVFRRLLRLRKAGRLQRLGRGDLPTPEASDDELELVRSLVERQVGSTGRRDQLPYTPEFDQLSADFRKTVRRDISDHELWLLVARVSK